MSAGASWHDDAADARAGRPPRTRLRHRADGVLIVLAVGAALAAVAGAAGWLWFVAAASAAYALAASP